MTTLLEFHFLRPLWLLALLPLAYPVWLVLRARGTASPWRRACDPELLDVLRAPDPSRAGRARWPGWLAAVLAVLALAGPAWQRLPQPLLELREARVVVLDLSRSMDAQDVVPSRAAKARHAITEVLDRLPPGRVALVAFAGSAHTAVPLTRDRALLGHLVAALSPDMMPMQGGRIDLGLEEALRLLEAGRAVAGDVVLVTDSVPSARARSAARAIASAGHRLWIAGVGTPAGGPVPLRDGSLLKNDAGVAVSPRLDEAALRDLARAGNGRYQRLATEHLDLDLSQWVPQSAEASAHFRTDRWRDEGRWLVLLVAPLAAFATRQGAALAAVLMLVWVRPVSAEDRTWSAWWRSPNGYGMQLLQEGQAAAAAGTFADPRWRGVAAWRAGRYADAAEAFAADTSADGHFNRGNALAAAGRYFEAVSAYDEALALDTGMADARRNREIVQRLLPLRAPNELPVGGSALLRAGDSGGAGPGAERGEGDRQRPGTASGTSRDATSGEPSGDGGAPAAVGGRAATQSAQRAAAQRTSRAPQASTQLEDSVAAPRHDSRRGRRSEADAMQPGAGGLTDVATDRAGEHAAWLDRVDANPAELLRRKFARDQELRPVVASDPPW